MKKLNLLFLLFVLFVAAACEKEVDATPLAEGLSITHVQLNGSVSKNTSQQIEVTLEKPTPCHELHSIRMSEDGMTVNYNFIVGSTAEVCAQVIEEEEVTVTFEPKLSGTYTLNFLVNGRQFQTRQVEVTN